jgi:hypothetical protein
MSASEIGTQLVQLCSAGKSDQAHDDLYDEKIVSIEGQGSEEMPARLEGLAAIRGKSKWWEENNEVHGNTVVGPFCGHREDQFAVHFVMDVTPNATGERTQLNEVALYTVANGKIVQEKFLYLMA